MTDSGSDVTIRSSEWTTTTTWNELTRSPFDVLAATAFFTTEVWTRCGLVTYYVLFFMQVATRRVYVAVAGMTPNPDERWMAQVARNVAMAETGFLAGSRYLVHDRDRKYCEHFRSIMEAGGVKPV